MSFRNPTTARWAAGALSVDSSAAPCVRPPPWNICSRRASALNCWPHGPSSTKSGSTAHTPPTPRSCRPRCRFIIISIPPGRCRRSSASASTTRNSSGWMSAVRCPAPILRSENPGASRRRLGVDLRLGRRWLAGMDLRWMNIDTRAPRRRRRCGNRKHRSVGCGIVRGLPVLSFVPAPLQRQYAELPGAGPANSRGGLPGLLDKLAALHAAGESGVLGVVFSTSGSTYQKPGAIVLLDRGGMRHGAISGGCLEPQLEDAARAALRQRPGADRRIRHAQR